MTDVPVVSMHKGKVQSGGGDAHDPGQALPPGTWPGSDRPGPRVPAKQLPAPGAWLGVSWLMGRLW